MKKIKGISPGYWYKGQWIFTGCRRHDKDPCNEGCEE